MATLSFSMFLGKLLDGSKTQTIREYKSYHLCRLCKKKGTEMRMLEHLASCDGAFEETTRLEVGDIVDIYWKQRVPIQNKEWILKDNYRKTYRIFNNYEAGHNYWSKMMDRNQSYQPAHKLFKAKITEIFKITMIGLTCSAGSWIEINKDGKQLTDEECEELASRDGFEQMRAYPGKVSFEEYFLSKIEKGSKEFVVCRWRRV